METEAETIGEATITQADAMTAREATVHGMIEILVGGKGGMPTARETETETGNAIVTTARETQIAAAMTEEVEVTVSANVAPAKNAKTRTAKRRNPPPPPHQPQAVSPAKP